MRNAGFVSASSEQLGAPSLESTMRTQTNEAGFTMIELLLVIAVVGILSAIAVPQVLGAREKARVATCDGLFHGLDEEIANEMDTVVHGENNEPSCGDMGTSWNDIKIMRCVIATHPEEKNPRNTSLKAYVNYYENPFPFESCQIGLDEDPGGAWQLGVMVRQFVSPTAPERTFMIMMD